MRLPRDLSGARLASLLGSYGYQVTRQSGSHMRLTSRRMGNPHRVTIPQHRSLRVGTPASIVTGVTQYLERERDELADELFGK